MIDKDTKFDGYRLEDVRRKPTVTQAIFIDSDRIREVKIDTLGGPILVDTPTWILWDQSGYPYPVHPSEFQMIYDIIDREVEKNRVQILADIDNADMDD